MTGARDRRYAPTFCRYRVAVATEPPPIGARWARLRQGGETVDRGRPLYSSQSMSRSG